METERLTLKISECAKALGISKNLCYELARRGELPGVIHLGGKRMVVSKAALAKLLAGEGQRKGVSNETTQF